MPEITIYDAANVPSPRRVRMVLIEKGLSFKIRWLNLGLLDQKQSWYLDLNPTGLVPTAVIGSRVIYESNVISEYIDAIHPAPPLVPKGAWEQAQMRMWFAFEGDFAKPLRDAVYETMAKQRLQSSGMSPEQLRAELSKRTSNEAYIHAAINVLTSPRDDGIIANRTQILLEKMAQMEKHLSDERPWLCGDHFTLADIALVPRIDIFPVIGVSDLYDRFPNIGAFVGRVKARPSWELSAIHPEADERERYVDPHKLRVRGEAP